MAKTKATTSGQKPQELSWSEVAELIDNRASESWIATRVKELREERGWKQSVLAAKLRELKIPISQPAISRIENMGTSDARDERRAITMREVIGLARVFDVSLVELLLPPDAMGEISGWRDLIAATEALNAARSAWYEYSDRIIELRSKMWSSGSGELYTRIASAQAAAAAKHAEDHREWFIRNPELGVSFEEFLSWQEPTPELAALDDVMTDRPMDSQAWAKGRIIADG